jgi:hypothetical protein
MLPDLKTWPQTRWKKKDNTIETGFQHVNKLQNLSWKKIGPYKSCQP